jgi:hypothetical protein
MKFRRKVTVDWLAVVSRQSSVFGFRLSAFGFRIRDAFDRLPKLNGESLPNICRSGNTSVGLISYNNPK